MLLPFPLRTSPQVFVMVSLFSLQAQPGQLPLLLLHKTQLAAAFGQLFCLLVAVADFCIASACDSLRATLVGGGSS